MKFNKLYPLLRWLTCLFTLAALLTPIILEAGRVYVRGYYRKNGTYVRPHYRTSPDGIPWNNYSHPGNYNPNTGKITAGDPNKYLERYYSSPPKRSSFITPKVKIARGYHEKHSFNRAVQSALKHLGYEIGPIDGIIGPKTRTAIQLFQLTNRLTPDGIIGPLTTKALADKLSSRQSDGRITIIDGDTFYYGGEKIRIYGIDAPEYGELGFYLATLRLAEALSSGTVTIERVAKDKYGRTIAKVKVNGIDIASYLK